MSESLCRKVVHKKGSVLQNLLYNLVCFVVKGSTSNTLDSGTVIFIVFVHFPIFHGTYALPIIFLKMVAFISHIDL